MDAIGRPKEAQWWHKEGRRVTQIDTQCSHFLLGDQWPTTVHPFCDHGDVCAFILPPLSDLWATDLLGDLCATVLNMLKTSRRPWRPWRCLNVLCATLEQLRQPFGFPSAFNGDLAPVPLSIFRSNSKFEENSKHSSVKYTWSITTICCARHDSVTVVTCANIVVIGRVYSKL